MLLRCIGPKWPMTQTADGLLGLDLNGQGPFRPVSNGQRWTLEASDVTWSQKSTLVYTLNPVLMHRSMATDVQMH